MTEGSKFGVSDSGSPGSVEVTGIYTTALTAILLGAGFRIARPSPTIRGRFGLPEDPEPGSAQVEDLPDRQGVTVRGAGETARRVVGALRWRLPFALFWREQSRYVVYFPLPVKFYLDAVRARYTPTPSGYHRLRSLGLRPPEVSDLAEGAILDINTKAFVSRMALETETVWSRLGPGQEFPIIHLKPGGRVIRLRATVERVENGRLVLRRQFRPGGIFDSLGEPIMPGDWGLVVLVAEGWWSRRLYYREDGTFVGEVININTPVEVFPDRAVYVDLELDILRLPDGAVRIVDAEELEAAVRRGWLSPALAQRAYEEAQKAALKLALGAGEFDC